MKYQLEPYYCSQNINKLIPKFEINDKLALYFITLIQKFVSKYNGQQGGYKLLELQNHKISIPINSNNEYDFKFMENCISELEEERISELTAYLKVSGLDNYELSNEEKNILNQFKINKIKFKHDKIENYFEINSSKRKYNANTVKFNGKYPYVARGSNNNGIRGYITEEIKYLNSEKTISFGQDTATIYYQENPYFTGDKIKVMSYKYGELTPEIANYFITTMRKSFSNFAWGQSSFNEKVLKETKINIPVNDDGTINYEFINTFVKIQEKLAIKDVVIWKDKIINKTKNIIMD